MRKFIYTQRRAGILSLLLLSFQLTFAQTTGTIKGMVKDVNGNPLSSASVTVEGQQGGTVTDASGNYLLKVSRVLIRWS